MSRPNVNDNNRLVAAQRRERLFGVSDAAGLAQRQEEADHPELAASIRDYRHFFGAAKSCWR